MFVLDKSFITRALVIVFIAPLIVSFLYLKPSSAEIMLTILGPAMLIEWAWMCKRAPFKTGDKLFWFFGGLSYIGSAFWGLYSFSNKLLFLFVILWATDIGAYLFGRHFGGPKLAPQISPNKTWSGAIGGFLCGVSAAALYSLGINDAQPLYISFLFAAGVSAVGQLGDLLESWTKRRMKLKDSSSIIPGHGGLLDRFDSLLLVGFLLWVLSKVVGFSFDFTH